MKGITESEVLKERLKEKSSESVEKGADADAKRGGFGVALCSIQACHKSFLKACSSRREHQKFLHEARCRQ
jgi:hypothetical protein